MAEPDPDPRGQLELSEEERERLRSLGQKIAERRLATPAILFLESTAPLHFVASQAMVGLGPLASLLVSEERWLGSARLLEKRGAVAHLVRCIEDADAELRREEKERKRREKEARKAAKKARRDGEH